MRVDLNYIVVKFMMIYNKGISVPLLIKSLLKVSDDLWSNGYDYECDFALLADGNYYSACVNTALSILSHAGLIKVIKLCDNSEPRVFVVDPSSWCKRRRSMMKWHEEDLDDKVEEIGDIICKSIVANPVKIHHHFRTIQVNDFIGLFSKEMEGRMDFDFIDDPEFLFYLDHYFSNRSKK